MKPRTSRLLMLLMGAVISGCASQTDRSSSGAGTQTQTAQAPVAGSSNAVTQAELERRAEAKAAAEAAAPQPAPQSAPAYEPEKEPVQYVDRPLEESAPPKAAVAAVAAKEEATPDFPVTKYELPEEQATDEAVDDIGAQEDESLFAEDEAVLAEESSIDESSEDADDLDTADSDMEEDESVLAEQEAAPAEESLVDESSEDADDLETADSDTEEAVLAEDTSVDETSEDADDLETADSGEDEDLGAPPDDSASVAVPEEKQVVAKDEPTPDFPVTKYELPDDQPPKAAAVAPQKAVPAAPKSVTVNFETEPLFNFDKSTIRADQSAKLDELISGLVGTQYDSVVVVGHADRIGNDAYNQKLSERRAAAVKAYLVKKGVPSDKIRTEGRGESESVTGDACNKTRGKALISCLQPDRRVDVSVSGTKQAN